MFCSKCGKAMLADAKFCMFCGAPSERLPEQGQPSEQAYAAPDGSLSRVQAPESAPEGTVLTPSDIPSAGFSYGESDSPDSSAPDTLNGTDTLDSPAPADTASSAPLQAAAADPSVQASPNLGQPADDRKYYTFGHIALCLAAVAVMAIVAGIFAGLYFSAI